MDMESGESMEIIKERPLVCTEESVRAILEKWKTQTRRIIKPQPIFCAKKQFDFMRTPESVYIWSPQKGEEWYAWESGRFQFDDLLITTKCPYGQPGDRLWVKETWCEYGNIFNSHEGYWYKASGIDQLHMDKVKFDICKWKSPRFMPRRASRIMLEIDEVRVERLQEIPPDDVYAEGIENKRPAEEAICDYCPLPERLRGVHCYGGEPVMCEGSHCGNAMEAWEDEAVREYADLWNSINSKRGYGWDVNPWVWAIKFHIL